MAGMSLAGCGYVGEILPPSLNIPQPVTDLRAIERGDRIVLQFTVPQTTTDGVLLRKLRQLDARAGTGGGTPFSVEAWAAEAQPIDNDIREPGPATLELPARGWVGRDVIFAVRASSPKGHFSAWSNLVVQHVVAPLAPPEAIKAETEASGVRLLWQAPPTPGLGFVVFRRPGAGGERETIGHSEKPEFLDATAQFGKNYEYLVQAVWRFGQSVAESELSAPVAITPQDRFPPAVPAGLQAIPSLGSITLNWERNTEPDLKGYWVYRSTGGGSLEKLVFVDTPAASDRNIESGRPYRYAVSAVDQLDNESARSAPVEITAP